MTIALEVFKHALIITLFVFVMMVLIDYLNVTTKGATSVIIKGGRWRQYIVASSLGATPGCLGAFLNVSFYIHGLISFGAITAGMIATSGDEAFVEFLADGFVFAENRFYWSPHILGTERLW